MSNEHIDEEVGDAPFTPRDSFGGVGDGGYYDDDEPVDSLELPVASIGGRGGGGDDGGGPFAPPSSSDDLVTPNRRSPGPATPHYRRRRVDSRQFALSLHNGFVSEHRIVATPLDDDEAKPMTPVERMLGDIKEYGRGALFRRSSSSGLESSSRWHGGGGGGGGEAGEDRRVGEGAGIAAEEGDENQNRMWRLQARRDNGRDVGRIRRSMRLMYACIRCGAANNSIEHVSYAGDGRCHPELWLSNFFGWLFRKGWATISVLSLISFYALVLLFTLLIMWAVEVDHDCLRIMGKTVDEIGKDSLFFDAFSLSWNTFSTVGYGSTYPALSTESNTDGDTRCAFISFVTAFEALVGVVYAGFTGAIIFAKVTRITQRAAVQFSDALTVTFGPGVEARLANDGKDESRDDVGRLGDDAEQVMAEPTPFPVISFRIANTMHAVEGAEIITASLNVAVIIENARHEHPVSVELARKISEDRMERLRPKRRRSNETEMSTGGMIVTERCSETSPQKAMTYLESLNELAYKGRSIIMSKKNEGVAGSKIPPLITFAKLELDASEHPLFKRIWKINHVVDQNSPLLTAEAKTAILNNKGRWPREWNNHQDVRRAIQFRNLVVSFTGLSNLTGALVYIQKLYEYVDTAVGYQFVNVMYMSKRGAHTVDLNLLDDVIEQNGGGAEPLNVRKDAL